MIIQGHYLIQQISSVASCDLDYSSHFSRWLPRSAGGDTRCLSDKIRILHINLIFCKKKKSFSYKRASYRHITRYAGISNLCISKPPLYVCLRHEVRTDGGQRHDVRTDQKVQDPARHHTALFGIYDRVEVTNRNESQAGA